MPYTLKQAAEAAGKSKPTILRAIQKGRISAARDEHGGWLIEPAELHRVYPPQAEADTRNDTHTSTDAMVALQREIEVRDETIAALKDQLEREREISADLQQDRDHWRQQATALLTDQREKSLQKATEGRWRRAWSILRGKA